MSFLQNLFNRSLKINAVTAEIDKFTYLINYRKYYAPILGAHSNDRALAELYLFRGWTTQFGYRVYSTNLASSEKLIGETLNLTMYLGLGAFQMMHGFSVEEVLGKDYMKLIESRWQTYDLTYIENKSSTGLPTEQILGSLNNFMQIHDPIVTLMLSADFLTQLSAIRDRAIKIGLMTSK